MKLWLTVVCVLSALRKPRSINELVVFSDTSFYELLFCIVGVQWWFVSFIIK